MVGLITGFILALLTIFYIDVLPTGALAFLPAMTGVFFGLLTTIAVIFLFVPLQRNEQRMTPRIIQLFTNDIRLQIFIASQLVYFLLSLWFSFYLAGDPSSAKKWLFAGWIILTGLIADFLVLLYSRFMNLLDPFAMIDILKEKGIHEERLGRDAELCYYLESIAEVSLRSTLNHSLSLCNASLNALRNVTESYLQTRKDKLYCVDKESEDYMRASYILYYVFDRMEGIGRTAAKEGLETICHHLISDLGKIAIEGARCDDSLVPLPLSYMSKVASQAEKYKMPKVGIKGNLVLLHVARIILEDETIPKSNLKVPMLAIVGELENIAKEAFRYDKDLIIPTLTQPLQELRELLQASPQAESEDMKEIIREVERVLGDFANLELILRTIPPIEVPEEESESKSKEPSS